MQETKEPAKQMKIHKVTKEILLVLNVLFQHSVLNCVFDGLQVLTVVKNKP